MADFWTSLSSGTPYGYTATGGGGDAGTSIAPDYSSFGRDTAADAAVRAAADKPVTAKGGPAGQTLTPYFSGGWEGAGDTANYKGPLALTGYTSGVLPGNIVAYYDPQGNFIKNVQQKTSLDALGSSIKQFGEGFVLPAAAMATGAYLLGPGGFGLGGAGGAGGAAELAGGAGGAGLGTYGGAGLYGDAAVGSGLATASGTGLTAAEIAAGAGGVGGIGTLPTYGGAGLYGDAAVGSGLATASGTGLTAAEIAAATAGTGAVVGNSLASAVAPVAAGLTVSQLLMAGVPLASAIIMADATKDAAKAQTDAVTQANNLQERMYNEQVARLAPYAAGGLTAQNQLMNVLGLGPNTGQPDYGKYSKDFSMADFQADPGYAFRMSEGLKALDRTAASRGGLMSGATLKGTQRYGQDLASQEYSNAFNRYQTNRTNQLQPLGNLMAAGQSAAGGQNTASGSYGTAGSELAQTQGNIAAQQGINTANAYTGALQSGISSYQNQNLMNQLLAYNSKP